MRTPLIDEHRAVYPHTYGRDDDKGPAPTSSVLNRLAELRCDPQTMAPKAISPQRDSTTSLKVRPEALSGKSLLREGAFSDRQLRRQRAQQGPKPTDNHYPTAFQQRSWTK